MPIYEYSCRACEHQLEALQKASEKPLVYCPECGEPKLRKLVSAAAFRLKGTGWYETDFKDNAKHNKKDAAEDKKAEGADDKKAKGEKSSETSKTSKGSKESATAKSGETKSKSTTPD